MHSVGSHSSSFAPLATRILHADLPRDGKVSRRGLLRGRGDVRCLGLFRLGGLVGRRGLWVPGEVQSAGCPELVSGDTIWPSSEQVGLPVLFAGLLSFGESR